MMPCAVSGLNYKRTGTPKRNCAPSIAIAAV
jgi:hypothetical protein